MALVSPLMEKLRTPVEDLIDQVFQIIKNTGLFYIGDIFSSKEIVKENLSELFVHLLTQCKDNCMSMTSTFIDCQT